MSQNALSARVRVWSCCFLRTSAAAHLRGEKRIIPLLAWDWDFGKASESCQKLTPCYISAQKQILNARLLGLSLLPHCPAHGDTHVLHLWLRRPSTPVSPIRHRLCRVTLACFTSQPAFFALLSCEWHSCGHSIKVRLEEMMQLPRTMLSAAGDRWPEREDRCEPAAGVWNIFSNALFFFALGSAPSWKHSVFSTSSFQLTALAAFFFSPLLTCAPPFPINRAFTLASLTGCNPNSYTPCHRKGLWALIIM